MKLAVVLVLSGCDAVYGLSGRHEPDAALVGDASRTDAEIDAAQPERFISGGDVDADGVLNFDDGCPLIPNAATTNADADDLPDACDPDPTTAGDCLLFLETFEQGLDPRWQNPSGWAIAGCAAPGLCSPPGVAATTHIYFGQAFPVTRVEAEIRVINFAISTLATTSLFSHFGPPPDEPSGRGCSLMRDNATVAKLALVDYGTDVSAVPSAGAAVAWSGTTFVLRFDGQVDCRRHLPAPEIEASNTIDTPPPGEFIGLQAAESRFAVRYVAGYGRCP